MPKRSNNPLGAPTSPSAPSRTLPRPPIMKPILFATGAIITGSAALVLALADAYLSAVFCLGSAIILAQLSRGKAGERGER